MVQGLDCLVGEAVLSKLFDVLMSAEICVHVCLRMGVCIYIWICHRGVRLSFSYGANLTKVNTWASVCGYSSTFSSEL